MIKTKVIQQTIFMLNNGSVSWILRRQNIIVLLTVETEYILTRSKLIKICTKEIGKGKEN